MKTNKRKEQEKRGKNKKTNKESLGPSEVAALKPSKQNKNKKTNQENKQTETNKEGWGPSEVAFWATSPDP